MAATIDMSLVKGSDIAETSLASTGGKRQMAVSNGRYGRNMPTRHVTDYAGAFEDFELLDLTSEIALCDARTNALMGQLSEGLPDAEEMLTLLRSAKEKIMEDMKGAAISDMDDAMQLVLAGAKEDIVWDKVNKQIKLREKLVTSERKFAEKLGAMMRVEQVLMIMSRLLIAIDMHVDDKQKMYLIRQEFGRIMADAQASVDRVVQSMNID